MTYAKDFLEYLKEKGQKTFTHRDILKGTTANCSYSVFREFKTLCEKLGLKLTEIGYEERKNKNNETKRFKRYLIEV